MSTHPKRFRSALLFSFGLLLIALFVGGPALWTAQSAGTTSGSKLRFAAHERGTAAAVQAGSKGQSKPSGNLDVRVNGTGKTAKLARAGSPAIVQRAQAQGLAIQKGLARLKANIPGVDAKFSPVTGAVEVLRNTTGAMTGPNPGRAGVDIVREFITNNSALYGLAAADITNLNFLGESVSPGSGMRMIRVEQVVNGLPVFQSETRFILDRDGRIFRSTGLLVPAATETAPPIGQWLSAEEALRQAMNSVHITLDVSRMSTTNSNAQGTKSEVVANDRQIAGKVTSKLVYFPLAPGVLLAAWSQVTFTNGEGDWYTMVDAVSGEVLWRKNIRDDVSTQDARFRVYVQADGKTPADSPAPLSPTTATPGSGLQPLGINPVIVSMFAAMNITASPNGWINDCSGFTPCTANETQTIGNNVHAYMDAQDGANDDLPDTDPTFVLDGNGKPTGNPDANGRNRDFLGTSPRDFETGYRPPPQDGNPESGQTATGDGNNGTLAVDQFRRGMVTQLFYVANWYHDRLFLLGFDEAAGNFQDTNFSDQGAGNDRVLAEAQDNSGTDNSNFSTPPDGESGRAQMFTFSGPNIDRDGSLDSEVLIHELTHGTSNRLIGDGSGLIWDPGSGMGEGWSDFYALSLLNNTNADNPNGSYAFGAYATYKFLFPNISPAYTDNYTYGIRRFPYSTDNSVNPLTWADVDDTTNDLSGGIAPDPLDNNFAGGFEVHNVGEIWALTLWEVRSRIIAANKSDVPTGNQKMLQLVTDALKLTPLNPSFTDARDALLDADCVTNSCVNEQSIWDGFADRGLGYNALVSSAYGFNFISSHQGLTESFSAPFLDVQKVSVDDSSGNDNGAIDPGEAIRIVVNLKNPWRSATKDVASATATLTSSTPGVMITDGNSTYPGIPAQGNANGDTFRFNVPGNATCGQSLKFTITSTSSLGTRAVDFTLRVGQANGNGTPITYTRVVPQGGLAIPDFEPRGVVDSITVTDDFEIADLNFRVDSLTHTFVGDLTGMLRAPNGYGTDLIALIGAGIGDGSGENLTNMVIDDQATAEMLIASSEDAPYTGSWLPIYNDPTWAAVGFGGPDPVGELGRLNGKSTQGAWKVLFSDQASFDTGTLNSWSLIVTPTAFVCTALVPTASDSSISGFITEANGSPLAGVVMILGGTQSRTTITDAHGAYSFNSVETDGFYTVTPALANFHFSPANRSFSLPGNKADAVFTAVPDAAASTNAIETNEYFVRQQYLDFLGREPEPEGLAFWSGKLDQCSGDTACLRAARTDISAAFFQSLEFGQTGAFVYRLYQGSLGRQLSYNEFSVDRGQVIGGANLETSRVAFANQFVTRAEFLQKYQAATSGESFVDALLTTVRDTSGADLSGERSNLLARYNAGGTMNEARALVVSQLGDNTALANATRNPSFVLMEYFGYLKRGAEPAGYAFWLNVLNTSEPQNYRGMVCSFLTSREYQLRFANVIARSNAECAELR